MVTGRPSSSSVAFHRLKTQDAPQAPLIRSPTLIRSSSRNLPPSHPGVTCVPDGTSTMVTDYLPGPIAGHVELCPVAAKRCHHVSHLSPRRTRHTGINLQKPPRKPPKYFWFRPRLNRPQQPVHDPDAGRQGGQRDALVGAVEHGVVVVAHREHQRREAVA